MAADESGRGSMYDFLRVVDTEGVEHYLGLAHIVDVDFHATPGAIIFTAGRRANDKPLWMTIGPEEAKKLRRVLDSRAGTTPDAAPRVWSLDDE